MSLRDYLHVARRRKWVILLAVVLVPIAAAGFSLRQAKLYQASAQVLLNSQNLSAQLTGIQASSLPIPAQPAVAQTESVATIAARSLNDPRVTPGRILGDSSVSVDVTTGILSFVATDTDPVLAQRIANSFAQAYTTYRRRLDTAAIERALTSIDRRLHALAKAGETSSALYGSLADRQETLQTMAALQTNNASVLRLAGGAGQTQPKPTRNAILGLLLGLVLGIALAFLRESLDTRVRNPDEIPSVLGGMPLLGRVPTPPRRLRDGERLVMLDDPLGVEAEAFRMLRTNLDFVTLDRDIRTIMITSAVQQEGKSTTIANLALAMARAGKRVALVDLDLRRPFIARFFELGGPGLTQVALGHVRLEHALASIAIAEPHAVAGGNGNGNGGKRTGALVKGVLEVLPSGPIPPDPGEFVGTATLTEILEELRERADIVLIDAPPILRVGDAIALSTKVDGIILASRLKVVRRNLLQELARQLSGLPTPVLGVVVTGAGTESGYGYGYGTGYHGYGYGRRYAPHPYESAARSES